MLTKLRKLATVTEHKSAELKAGRGPAVRRRRGPRRTAAGSTRRRRQALVQAVGQDLRSLAAAADQLSHDFRGRDHHRGGGEALLRRPGRGQVVRRSPTPRSSDAARPRSRSCAGRWRPGCTATCSSPRRSPARPAVWPATARRPRTSARPTSPARSACRRGSSRTCGPSPAAGPSHGLARAIRAVAQADADIKGAASDASYTLERLVLTITGLRETRPP